MKVHDDRRDEGRHVERGRGDQGAGRSRWTWPSWTPSWLKDLLREWWLLALFVALFLSFGLASLNFWYLGAVVSVVVVFALALLGWGLWGELIRALGLVLIVLGLGGLALFFTAQGRDLGVGLLEGTGWQVVVFGAALLYWASATWHAAILALQRSLDDGASQDTAVRLLPRLLGGVVHFFAALSIAFAGSGVGHGWAAFIPVAVLVIGTLGLGLLEIYLSADTRHKTRLKLAVCVTLASIVIVTHVLLEYFLPSGVSLWPYMVSPISAALFVVLILFHKAVGHWTKEKLEDRASLKWVADGLEGIFERPRRDARLPAAWSSIILIVLLLVVGVVFVGWTIIDPVAIGQGAGAVAIAFFAFGAYTTVLEAIWLFGGKRAMAILVFLILIAVVTGLTRDYHVVRTCRDAPEACGRSAGLEVGGEAGMVAAWADRPTVAEAAEGWQELAAAEAHPGEAVPMIVVATAGGGIRAAYWTALVLQQLEERLGQEGFRRHLFAISAVSGGAVGAAFYAAAAMHDDGSGRAALRLLEQDFLGPAVAALVFADGPASMLPDVVSTDRGYALERAWEEAFDGSGGPGLEVGFLDLFPFPLEDGEAWHPALLLNATHQQTGRRVIASHVQVEQRVFLDSWDLHELIGADLPASTAAHNSARFTYVSPAGELVRREPEAESEERFGLLLDGGYFENYGAITALQITRHALAALDPEPVRPVIVLISSDPGLLERDRSRVHEREDFCRGESDPFLRFDPGDRESDYLLPNEMIAPVAGVLAGREAHGTLALKELARSVCFEPDDDRRREEPDQGDVTVQAPAPIEPAAGPADTTPVFAHFVMCKLEGDTAPPLGWVLSASARTMIHDMIGDPEDDVCGNRGELEKVARVFD